jgi:hypothetical protein
MIGSISSAVDTADVVSIPPGIIASPFYGYGSGYDASAVIEPGLGCWVKVSFAGSLVFSSTSVAVTTATPRSRDLEKKPVPTSR